MANGMFSQLFGVPAVDPAEAAEEERLRRLGAMDPFQAAATTAYSGSAQAGRGLGQVAAGLTGRDVRTPTAKRNAALEAAKAEIAQLGAKPDREVILAILRKHGLLGESLDVGSAMTDQAATAERLRIAAEESARKQAKDLATDARTKERNEILRRNGAPELIKMIEVVEEFPEGSPQRKMRLDALNAELESRKKGIVLADAGGRIVPVSRATGLPMGTEIEKTPAPLSEKEAAKAEKADTAQATAYRNAMGALQNTYNAAARLYNHSGVEGITGRLGRLVGSAGPSGETGFIREGATTLASPEARAALALWKQVTGSTFLEGLNQLKAASPVGSTGLGQVSNIEGEKVQSAAAALSREQDAPDFRLNLKVYLGKLEEAATALAAAAPLDKIDPIPLQKLPLKETGRAAARPRPAAAAPAASAPAATNAKGWKLMKDAAGNQAYVSPDGTQFEEVK